jgi:exopolysaccharide biosynthesis protein
VNYVDKSRAIETPALDFVYRRCSRSAVGFDANGNLMFMEIDGVENFGINLYEWADIAVQLGAYNAINLDGSGSVSFYSNGQIVNEFTDYCGITPAPCAR